MHATFPVLPQIPLSIVFNTPVLTILLIVFGIFYGVVSLVLFYHWSAYGMKSPGILVAETLFSFISVILFVIASLAIHYF